MNVTTYQLKDFKIRLAYSGNYSKNFGLKQFYIHTKASLNKIIKFVHIATYVFLSDESLLT